MSLNQNSIYVCTFCQVFSSKEEDIVTHIKGKHTSTLPVGTKAENFVSKLQKLSSESEKNAKNFQPKRTTVKKSSSPSKEKEKNFLDPVPKSDGFYWCEKCVKRFKTVRQITRHICFRLNGEEDECEDVSSVKSENCHSYMMIETYPLHRKKLQKNKRCLKSFTGEVINWKKDPSYLQLFQNKQQRTDFECHLKTIDISFVDHLFIKKCMSSISTYVCIVCEMVLNSLPHVRMHCLSHTDAKPFTCPQCDYCTNHKGSLYTHIRTHTGNVFRCTQCTFHCKKRVHLLEHEETHSEVPHLCQLCKNVYKTSKSLTMHVRKYHHNYKGKRYLETLTSKRSTSEVAKTLVSCSVCAKHFKSQSSLDAHILKVHTTPDVAVDTGKIEFSENVNRNESETAIDVQEVVLSDSVEQRNDNLVEYALEEIVLDDLLPQCKEFSIKLYDVFRNVNLKEHYPGYLPMPSSHSCDSSKNVEVTDKDLSLELLNECFHQNEESARNTEQRYYVDRDASSNPTQTQLGLEKRLDLDILEECMKESDITDSTLDNYQNPESSSQNRASFEMNTDLSQCKEFSIKLHDVLRDLNLKQTYPNIDLPGPSSKASEKELSLRILKECLKETEFGDIDGDPEKRYYVDNTTTAHPQKQFDVNFDILDECLKESSGSKGYPLDMDLGKSSETVSAETKLFEKCRRAPAYVCCVCSAIYICPSTLKAHLKEHVNPLVETDLENVCRMLEEPSLTEDEKELEKLYSSSLDMMWYLPGVSVVLENDTFLDLENDDLPM